MQSPVIEQLSEERQDVNFYKMDVDQNQDTAKNLGIMAIPTLIIKKDGNIVDRITGYTQRKSWTKFWINTLIKEKDNQKSLRPIGLRLFTMLLFL